MRLLVCFFFFKQKTAYEMRISDWSSDVCSSDLDARLDAHNGWRCDAGGRGSQRSGDDARQEHLPDPGVGHLPLYARRRRQTDRPDDVQRYDLHEPAPPGLDFDGWRLCTPALPGRRPDDPQLIAGSLNPK